MSVSKIEKNKTTDCTRGIGNCLIKASNVSFSYDGIDDVLQDVNIDIHERDCIAITGPNGGGKTTLLRLLSGILECRRGKIEITAQHPKKKRKQIGYVPQNIYYDKYFPIKVIQVVLMGRLGTRSRLLWYTKEDKAIAIKNLERMGIGHLANQSFPSLSGGQKQRVLIARALTTNSPILVFDEPTSNLDTPSQKQFYAELKSLNKEYTILVVTHNINSIPHFAKTVFFVNRTVDSYSLTETEPDFLSWYQEKINV